MVHSPVLQEDERLDIVNEDIRLIQKKGGLTFGTDAYLLAAFVRSVPASVCVDLGSGTGIVALLCQAKKKFLHSYAVEIQPEFCELIQRNAALNDLSDCISVLPGDIRNLHSSDIPQRVSSIVSNPPYMADGCGLSNADPRMEIARREKNGSIYDFCQTASRLLSSGGTFSIVFRPDRMADLFSALRGSRLEPKRMVTVYPDCASRPCLVLIEARKDGSPELIQAPPLIIYKSREDRTYTAPMQKVYDTFSLDFLFSMRKEDQYELYKYE